MLFRALFTADQRYLVSVDNGTDLIFPVGQLKRIQQKTFLGFLHVLESNPNPQLVFDALLKVDRQSKREYLMVSTVTKHCYISLIGWVSIFNLDDNLKPLNIQI